MEEVNMIDTNSMSPAKVVNSRKRKREHDMSETERFSKLKEDISTAITKKCYSKVPVYIMKQLEKMREVFGPHPHNTSFMAFLNEAGNNSRTLLVEHILENYIFTSSDIMYNELRVKTVRKATAKMGFNEILIVTLSLKPCPMQGRNMLLNMISKLLTISEVYEAPETLTIFHLFLTVYLEKDNEVAFIKTLLEEVTFCMQRHRLAFLELEELLLMLLRILLAKINFADIEKSWKDDYLMKSVTCINPCAEDDQHQVAINNFFRKANCLLMSTIIGDIDLRKPLQVAISKQNTEVAILLIKKFAPVDDLDLYWGGFGPNTENLFRILFFAGHHFEPIHKLKVHMLANDEDCRFKLSSFCDWLERQRKKVWPLKCLAWNRAREAYGSRALDILGEIRDAFDLEADLLAFMTMESFRILESKG